MRCITEKRWSFGFKSVYGDRQVFTSSHLFKQRVVNEARQVLSDAIKFETLPRDIQICTRDVRYGATCVQYYYPKCFNCAVGWRKFFAILALSGITELSTFFGVLCTLLAKKNGTPPIKTLVAI